MRKRPVPELWAADIESWLMWLRAAGRPGSTVNLRRSQMARLARNFPATGPWALGAEELVMWLGGHGWDADTIRSHRAALRGFYSWGQTTGRSALNPAAALPSVKAKPGRPRPAPEDSIRVAKLAADDRDALMIQLGSEAGLRACEIARVHTDDIFQDFTGWSLDVLGKGNKRRLVPLSPRLALALRVLPAGYIFPGRIDGHLSAAYVSKRLSWALGKGLTGHMLRHRFASIAYAAGGCDIRAVQDLMGHASPETTARYTAVPDGAKRAAVMAAAS